MTYLFASIIGALIATLAWVLLGARRQYAARQMVHNLENTIDQIEDEVTRESLKSNLADYLNQRTGNR